MKKYFLLLIVLGLCFAPKAFAAPAFVQIATSTNTSATTVTTTTFKLANATSDLIVVYPEAYVGSNSSSIITGITDSAGNTYVSSTPILTVSNGSNYGSGQEWYAQNIKAYSASNTISVTYSPSSSASFWRLQAAEYSGVATSGVLDTSIATTSRTTSVSFLTTGSSTTSNANDLFVAEQDDYNGSGVLSIGTSTPASSTWNNRYQNSTHEIWADTNVTSTGTYSFGLNSSVADVVMSFMSTFKGAGVPVTSDITLGIGSSYTIKSGVTIR